jgi:hypothetical protein
MQMRPTLINVETNQLLSESSPPWLATPGHYYSNHLCHQSSSFFPSDALPLDGYASLSTSRMVMSPPDPEPWIWERSMPKSFALRFAAFVALGSSTVRSLADCPCFWRIDREERNAEQRKDLDRRSDGKVTFTKRRMYENYLLNSQAIASVVSTLEGFSERGEVTPDDVEIWLEDHGEDPMYFGGSEKISFAIRVCMVVQRTRCEVIGRLIPGLIRDPSGIRQGRSRTSACAVADRERARRLRRTCPAN